MIKKTYIEDKYTRGQKKRYKRKRVFRYAVFQFPKDRKVWRADNLHNVKFNYSPKTSNNFASDEIRNRMYELSSKKIYWAQLVVNGMDMAQAVQVVFPRVTSPNKQLKQLLLNDKLMDFVVSKSGLDAKSAFEMNELNAQYLALKIMNILEDGDSPTALKVTAIEIAHAVLKREKRNCHT